jgi:hypothetical protein
VSINLETVTTPATGPPTGGLILDGSDLHVLRLCLDLQLDALLLAVGAASGELNESGPPWRRWVNEDIQSACNLASNAHTGGAGPPSGLGSDLDRALSHTTENGLHARYTSMLALLSGLISRPRTDDVTHEDPPQPWGPGVASALAHCQDRLTELEEHPWRPDHRGPGRRPQAQDSYLPGELLG